MQPEKLISFLNGSRMHRSMIEMSGHMLRKETLTEENLAMICEFVKKDTKITVLAIDDFALDDAAAVYLATNLPPTIEKLSLFNNNITDTGAAALAGNPNFKGLILSANFITEVGARAFFDTNLERLHLSANPIPRDFAEGEMTARMKERKVDFRITERTAGGTLPRTNAMTQSMTGSMLSSSMLSSQLSGSMFVSSSNPVGESPRQATTDSSNKGPV